jgi:pimeloyl-ACP methyl ester carboxylesterase
VRRRLLVLVLLLVSACSGSTTRTAPSPTVSPSAMASAPSVAHPTVWLCQPAATDDPCDVSLISTSIRGDGSRTVEEPTRADQPVDCFYVYPTVSEAKSLNAPLRATEAETRTARAQVARFSSACRVFAPVYRQLTVQALLTGRFGDAAGRELAHGDVVSAWHDYLRHNPTRKFVLIGHSQGSFELLRLMQEEIDANAALRSRLVSALLIGGNVKVPPGKEVGGDLQNIPLCTSSTQRGCVVTYNTFDTTPPATALFGRADTIRHLDAACTNPAALDGGIGELRPAFPAGAFAAGLGAFPGSEAITTPFVTYPDYLTAECRQDQGRAWLQVTVHPVAGDRRPTTLPKTLGPDWGLHLVDVNIALDNLVALVRSES